MCFFSFIVDDNKLYDIIKDRIFNAANIVFEGYMVKIREEGKAHSQPKPTIDRDDAKRLYQQVFMDTNQPPIPCVL